MSKKRWKRRHAACLRVWALLDAVDSGRLRMALIEASEELDAASLAIDATVIADAPFCGIPDALW